MRLPIPGTRLPSPVAVLAVAENVICGLVARHAYQEVSLAALFLVPMAVGYRSVSSSDERQVGVLTPAAALLMMLAAGIAQGWAGVIFVLMLMPVFMLMALLGGALASVVRATCDTASRMAQRLARITGRLHHGSARESASPDASPRAERDRVHKDEDLRDAWRQVIIRTPF